MEQEETKGCSCVTIDAQDPGQGLCTISLAKVSQRAVSMSTAFEVDYNCCIFSGWRARGKDPGLRVA